MRELEADPLSLYLEELKELAPLSGEEEALMLSKARGGDPSARARLQEACLPAALELVRELAGGPLGIPEAIGISNLALVEAVGDYLKSPGGAGEKGAKTLREAASEAVRAALRSALDEELRVQRGGEELAEKANRLADISADMASELGREALPEELAERMRVSPEELRALLDMSMRALE